MSGNKPADPDSTPDEELDDALDDTFPASDPLSQTDPSHGKVGQTDKE